MSDVDPGLAAALRKQLARRSGERVGWKLGVGDRERIGGHIAVGHLTSRTLLESGAVYGGAGDSLHADAEIAVEIGPGETVAAYGAALEIVDLGRPPDDPEAVVVANVFHRAVAFGPSNSWPEGDVRGSLIVNGEERASALAPRDLEGKLAEARRILAAVGERMEPGDRVITGSVAQVPVEAGDHVVADFGPLGRTWLSIA
jgi:hypothetical protein